MPLELLEIAKSFNFQIGDIFIDLERF